MNFPSKKKEKATYTRTRRKLPQNYDITLACDLMEFPLRAQIIAGAPERK